MSCFGLYSGFFVELRNTPAWLVPICEINPVRAAYELFLAAHFGDQILECGDVPLEERTVPCPLPGDNVLGGRK